MSEPRRGFGEDFWRCMNVESSWWVRTRGIYCMALERYGDGRGWRLSSWHLAMFMIRTKGWGRLQWIGSEIGVLSQERGGAGARAGAGQ